MERPLKWPGGKSWLAPRVSRLIEEVEPTTVAEPFCGGLSFSLHYKFERVIANDIITPLINFYRHIQAGAKPNPADWQLGEHFYNDVKARFNQMVDDGKLNSREAADMFWYLNKHGFNGMVRFNQKGHWNISIGDYKQVSSPIGFDNFYDVSRRWKFSNGSFQDLDVSTAKLLLADPPYAHVSETAKVFANYSGKGFKFNKQIELADWLADHSMPMIACNSPNKELAQIYKARGFKVYITMAPRSVSCKGNGRGKVPEMLAFKGFGENRKFSLLVDEISHWRL
ncbi:Dam family site-specific DNA-(adenine-N6)-methyltransferase [Vibrio parahaemolyticus]|uniref:DNA adenine methylase n=1 Tax=Vibrio parahaemolyticus TaxID=670 RepID=UPI0023ED1204|nr:Dam family site-specific DNA-(adenine-N6)-methyltransferase [Vibrio parahaemolyticus]